MNHPMIPMGPIDQIALVVDDIESACEVFSASHGAQAWSRYVYDRDLLTHMTYRGQRGDYSMYLAMAGRHPQIELIQPLAGESLYTEHLRERGPGLHHLGVVVDDLEETVRVMADAGFSVVMSGGGHGVDGDGEFAYFDTLDVAGTYYEAIVPPRRRRESLEAFPRLVT